MHVIGDVHGQISRYNDLCSGLDYSVQLGDLGFDYSCLAVDSNKHKFFGGNHDNYFYYNSTPGNLGDYGLASLGGIDFFFVRGAFSIDIAYRLGKKPKSWWCREELSFQEMLGCLRLYSEVKPDLVITHTCPYSITKILGSDYMLERCGLDSTFVCQTSSLLQEMFEVHQPKQWIFGHFHKSWHQVINGTKFVCLNELEHYEII